MVSIRPTLEPRVKCGACDYTLCMQTAQPTGRPHRNQGLFSDHYLNATLPARPDWGGLVDEARPAMEQIASLLETYTPSENEAQVEEDLVRPVLRLLGHTFEVQPALATPEGTKRPDYVLYGDARSVAANKGKTLTDELLSGHAFAVADAKYWDRPLDLSLRSSTRDAFSNDKDSEHKRAPLATIPSGVGVTSSLSSL
jgi:hypothetical protein